MTDFFRSREQAQYSESIENHLKQGGKPLLIEGAAGLGKTRGYLRALANQKGQVVISVPTRALGHQLMESADWALTMQGRSATFFTPRIHFESAQEYKEHRRLCMEVDVLVCTHQIVLLDVYSGGTILDIKCRAAILFDEADQFPDAAALRFDCALDAAFFERLGIPKINDQHLRVEKALKALDGGAMGDEDVAELRAICRTLLAALEEKSKGELQWFRVVGESEGGIRLKHRLPARILRSLHSHPRLIFTSATLTVGGSFTDFQRAMGLEEISPFSGCIEPKHHGQLEFTYADWDVEDESHANKVAALTATLSGFTLVVTTSFDEAQKIHDFLEQVPQLRDGFNGSTLRARDETTGEAAKRMLEDGKSILVATAAWAGLDTPIRWSHVVLPRAPFSPPTEIDGKYETRYIDSVISAIRKLRQVMARGLRQPDSYCAVHMLDKRFQRPVFRSAIPKRFDASYEAKYAVTEVRTRQAQFRDMMLKEWGGKCPVTDCSVLEAVDAAHIGSKGGWRRNHTKGILLRSDVHRIFDSGLLSIVDGVVVTQADGYEQYNGKVIDRMVPAK